MVELSAINWIPGQASCNFGIRVMLLLLSQLCVSHRSKPCESLSSKSEAVTGLKQCKQQSVNVFLRRTQTQTDRTSLYITQTTGFVLLTFKLWLTEPVTRQQVTSHCIQTDKRNQSGQKAVLRGQRRGNSDCKPCCQSIRFSLSARKRPSVLQPNHIWRTLRGCVRCSVK